MYLSRLLIRNYKSVEELNIEFREGKNVIVGKNNSGKSNIVKAIDLILGEGTPDYHKSNNLSENDFFNGDTSKDVIIIAFLSRDQEEQLNYEEIDKCYGYHIYGSCTWTKVDGRNTPGVISPKRVKIREESSSDLSSDVKQIFQVDFDELPNTEKVYINPKLKNQKPFKDQLDDKFCFAYIFYATFDVEHAVIRKDLRFLYRENDERDWVLASKASIRNELLQSAIIPAFRDPQNQLRATNYTWYGKLLQNYIDKDNSELKDAFAQVKVASTKVFEQLKKQIGDSRVQVAFPDTDISFQFNPDTKQDLYKSALIYVDDGFNSLLEDKGSGIQSAVIIGLFDFYVRKISHVSSSLLAIEEPELYLHPHGRRVISNRLEDFLEGKKNQVIITTHSSEFIASTEKDINIILVKKEDGKTTACSTFFKNPKDKRLLLKGQNTEMFFANSVILVEGGEKYIFDVVARGFGLKMNPPNETWLDDENFSIISASGKTEFLKYSLKLDELGIPWMVFADFDFIRDGLCEFLNGKKAEKILIDQINTLKADISKALGAEKKYKKISELPTEFHERVKGLISGLLEHNLYIFSGELEDFYTTESNTKCSGLGKEEKAICVASEIIATKEEEFIITEEVYGGFSAFRDKINKMSSLAPAKPEPATPEPAREVSITNEEINLDDIPF